MCGHVSESDESELIDCAVGASDHTEYNTGAIDDTEVDYPESDVCVTREVTRSAKARKHAARVEARHLASAIGPKIEAISAMCASDRMRKLQEVDSMRDVVGEQGVQRINAILKHF